MATGCMWPLLTWLPCDILGTKTSQPAPGVSDLPEEVCLNFCAAFSAHPSLATTHVHEHTPQPQDTCCALEHRPPALGVDQLSRVDTRGNAAPWSGQQGRMGLVDLKTNNIPFGETLKQRKN